MKAVTRPDCRCRRCDSVLACPDGALDTYLTLTCPFCLPNLLWDRSWEQQCLTGAKHAGGGKARPRAARPPALRSP
jgi:hypothetical protein